MANINAELNKLKQVAQKKLKESKQKIINPKKII